MKCFLVFFRYAEKNGYPVLNHVTLPRIGALKTILDTIGVPFSDNPNADINGK